MWVQANSVQCKSYLVAAISTSVDSTTVVWWYDAYSDLAIVYELHVCSCWVFNRFITC